MSSPTTFTHDMSSPRCKGSVGDPTLSRDIAEIEYTKGGQPSLLDLVLRG